jgi:hypothetical protein
MSSRRASSNNSKIEQLFKEWATNKKLPLGWHNKVIDFIDGMKPNYQWGGSSHQCIWCNDFHEDYATIVMEVPSYPPIGSYTAVDLNFPDHKAEELIAEFGVCFLCYRTISSYVSLSQPYMGFAMERMTLNPRIDGILQGHLPEDIIEHCEGLRKDHLCGCCNKKFKDVVDVRSNGDDWRAQGYYLPVGFRDDDFIRGPWHLCFTCEATFEGREQLLIGEDNPTIEMCAVSGEHYFVTQEEIKSREYNDIVGQYVCPRYACEELKLQNKARYTTEPCFFCGESTSFDRMYFPPIGDSTPPERCDDCEGKKLTNIGTLKGYEKWDKSLRIEILIYYEALVKKDYDYTGSGPKLRWMPSSEIIYHYIIKAWNFEVNKNFSIWYDSAQDQKGFKSPDIAMFKGTIHAKKLLHQHVG